MYTIAIQSKGRIYEESIAYLAARGIFFPTKSRELAVTSYDQTFQIIFLKNSEIPQFVAHYTLDLGIVGLNTVLEKNVNVTIQDVLPFGGCRLAIAVPQDMKDPISLEGKKIATSHPEILRAYCQINEIQAEIISVSGSVEVMPTLGISDMICDLVQTGSTLAANNLREERVILQSQAVLISSQKNLPKELINRLKCQSICKCSLKI